MPDDGISVESTPDSDVSRGEAWVHVHVADPSALIHCRDLIAREAERLGVTAYFAERVWPNDTTLAYAQPVESRDIPSCEPIKHPYCSTRAYTQFARCKRRQPRRIEG